MNSWLKENWFKAIIAFSILIISFAMGFRYIVRPIINEKQLTMCLQEIGEINLCGEFFGDIAQKYNLCKPEEKIKELRNECFKKYP